MPETNEMVSETVYESPPSEPDDDFWLEQGGRMLSESLALPCAPPPARC
jgi:hypothetical protein